MDNIIFKLYCLEKGQEHKYYRDLEEALENVENKETDVLYGMIYSDYTETYLDKVAKYDYEKKDWIFFKEIKRKDNWFTRIIQKIRKFFRKFS